MEKRRLEVDVGVILGAGKRGYQVEGTWRTARCTHALLHTAACHAHTVEARGDHAPKRPAGRDEYSRTEVNAAARSWGSCWKKGSLPTTAKQFAISASVRALCLCMQGRVEAIHPR